MQSPDFASLETFVAIADTGSFSRDADKLGASTGAVSRRLSGLEERLGLRLINRTTRQISLTEAGEHYYRDVRAILQSLAEAEDRVSHLSESPSGTLRVAAPLSFGVRALAPLLPGFIQRYPNLRLTLDLDDRMVDILAAGADLALRIGPLADSSLIARPIGEVRRVVCAAPEYLAARGEPELPKDLTRHACLHYSNVGLKEEWTLIGPDGPVVVEVEGPLCANNGDLLRRAAVGGMGIASLPDFIVAEDLAAGRLRPVLGAYTTRPMPLCALWPSRQFVPAKVRVFLDYLGEALNPKRASVRK